MGRGAVVVGIVACCAVGVQPAAARPKEDRSGGTPGGALDLAIAVSAAPISPDPFTGRGVTRIRLRTSDAADRLAATTTVHDRVGRVFQTGTDVAVGGATISVRPRYANGGRLFPGRYLVEGTVGDEAGNESSGRGRPWRVHRSMPARVIRRLD